MRRGVFDVYNFCFSFSALLGGGCDERDGTAERAERGKVAQKRYMFYFSFIFPGRPRAAGSGQWTGENASRQAPRTVGASGQVGGGWAVSGQSSVVVVVVVARWVVWSTTPPLGNRGVR